MFIKMMRLLNKLMKLLVWLALLLFECFFEIKGSHIRKFKVKGKSGKFSQNRNNYYTDIIGGNSNFETDSKSKFNSIAVTSSVASPNRVIPSANEIFKTAVTPQYVDQLKYYNDKPSQREVEAISNGSDTGTFYTPFSGKRAISSVTLPAQNCNYYGSMIDCHSSGYCIWDKAIGLCVYRQILIPII